MKFFRIIFIFVLVFLNFTACSDTPELRKSGSAPEPRPESSQVLESAGEEKYEDLEPVDKAEDQASARKDADDRVRITATQRPVSELSESLGAKIAGNVRKNETAAKGEATTKAVKAEARAEAEYAFADNAAGPADEIARAEVPANGAVYHIPAFPWPPPKASSIAKLPNRFFVGATSKQINLSDVDRLLSSALDHTGYYDKSYYSVPAGFAIVTRLEQIYEDGRPKPDPQRWAIDVGPIQEFSIGAYIKALFTSNPGYFRIIVFIVTHYPFTQSRVEIDDHEALALLAGGLNKLPDSIGRRPYTQNYACSALIYEFEKKASEKQQMKKNMIPGRLTGRKHLVSSNLWQYLER